MTDLVPLIVKIRSWFNKMFICWAVSPLFHQRRLFPLISLKRKKGSQGVFILCTDVSNVQFLLMRFERVRLNSSEA